MLAIFGTQESVLYCPLFGESFIGGSTVYIATGLCVTYGTFVLGAGGRYLQLISPFLFQLWSWIQQI